MQFFTKGPNSFYSVAEILDHSGRKMLKRVGNTAYVLGWGGWQPLLSAQLAAAALWQLRPAAAVVISVRSPLPSSIPHILRR
jgi:hypothetical protein